MSAQQPFVTDAKGVRRFACAPVAVEGILVNEAEQVLLLSHPLRQGAWQVVSGACEAGETLLQGVLREIREEAGPDVRVRPLGTVHAQSFHFDANVWSKNRFVGLHAGRVAGGFLSDPFYPQGKTINVDADVRGWLRAELCDVFGRKHEGYHLMDALPVSGDSSTHVLRWQDADTARFRYDAVRLRFEFVDGEIYGIGF